MFQKEIVNQHSEKPGQENDTGYPRDGSTRGEVHSNERPGCHHSWVDNSGGKRFIDKSKQLPGASRKRSSYSKFDFNPLCCEYYSVTFPDAIELVTEEPERNHNSEETDGAQELLESNTFKMLFGSSDITP